MVLDVIKVTNLNVMGKNVESDENEGKNGKAMLTRHMEKRLARQSTRGKFAFY